MRFFSHPGFRTAFHSALFARLERGNFSGIPLGKKPEFIEKAAQIVTQLASRETTIDLSSCYLDDIAAEYIVSSFSGSNLESVNLSGNRIKGNSVIISKLAQSFVNKVDLSRNPLDDKGVGNIAAWLREQGSGSLNTLKLANIESCPLTRVIDGLNWRIKYFDMRGSGNPLMDTDVKLLAEKQEKYPHMQILIHGTWRDSEDVEGMAAELPLIFPDIKPALIERLGVAMVKANEIRNLWCSPPFRP